MVAHPTSGASQESGGLCAHGQLGSSQTWEGLDRVGILLHHLVVEHIHLQYCEK